MLIICMLYEAYRSIPSSDSSYSDMLYGRKFPICVSPPKCMAKP